MDRWQPHTRVAQKYVLRKRIAIGGMGEIWVATNEATRADVALKILRPDADPALQARERFRHEARLSAMLSHRSIVRVFDLVEEADGTLVLVMELLRGETLAALVARDGARPTHEAIAILLPVLSALQHAHENGVIHRDISPSNIFLAVDPDGTVTPKLVDFGIAKVPHAKEDSIRTLDGRVLGTPRYMSPEQIRAKDDLDGRCDLFSVGVVLYEAMSGVSPFAGTTPAASLAAVLETTVDPDPRIDPRVWLEVSRAMSKRAYERQSSAAELAKALREAVGATDEALAATLKRTPLPMDASSTFNPPHLGMDTKSVEGQSVAPRMAKRVMIAPISVGVAVLGLGAAALFAAFVLRTTAPPESMTSAPSPAEKQHGTSHSEAPPSLSADRGSPNPAPTFVATGVAAGAVGTESPIESQPRAIGVAPPLAATMRMGVGRPLPAAIPVAPSAAPVPTPAVTTPPTATTVAAPSAKPLATTPGF